MATDIYGRKSPIEESEAMQSGTCLIVDLAGVAKDLDDGRYVDSDQQLGNLTFKVEMFRQLTRFCYTPNMVAMLTVIEGFHDLIQEAAIAE